MQVRTSLAFTQAQAESVLGTWLGAPVRCKSIQPLPGGMVNTVLRMTFDRPPSSAVIKLSLPSQSFSQEALMLRTLREARFPCPAVYLEDSSASSLPYAFLLLEALPGVNMHDLWLSASDRRRIDTELSRILLDLHSHTREDFGLIDERPGRERWTDVFLPRLREVRGQPSVGARLLSQVLQKVDAAIELAERALSDQGTPTLVHGDLWAANFIVEPTDEGWRLSGIVDPGAHYADVEMELAYLEEFSSVVGPTFWEIYTRASPHRPGYSFRRLFYWLHTYLVHVWLFEDQHYRDKTEWVTDQIQANAPAHV